jgi:two-component SAPR family response regulator
VRPTRLDLLWPDQGESVASPRLSVALSTVRSVLDPTKQYPPDKFVGADRATIWLDGDETDVDVEIFLHDARAGLDGSSLPLLRGAEAAYSGDFLEEDIYADWADGMREEARALYVRVTRVLAERSKGDPDAAAGYVLRILQRDQYDERAHLGLVSAFQEPSRVDLPNPASATTVSRRRRDPSSRSATSRGRETAPYDAGPPPTGIPHLPSSPRQDNTAATTPQQCRP